MNKSFLEIEKPEKKIYAVVVIEIKDDAECKHTDPIFNKAGGKVGALLCDSNFGEIYDCDCCGLPTCELEHMSERTIHTMFICKICESLPAGIIEKIQALRAEINNAI